MPGVPPRRRLVVVGAGVLLGAVALLVVLAIRQTDPYADLRQASTQEIPG